jgi:hypothetical protein
MKVSGGQVVESRVFLGYNDFGLGYLHNCEIVLKLSDTTAWAKKIGIQR